MPLSFDKVYKVTRYHPSGDSTELIGAGVRTALSSFGSRPVVRVEFVSNAYNNRIYGFWADPDKVSVEGDTIIYRDIKGDEVVKWKFEPLTIDVLKGMNDLSNLTNLLGMFGDDDDADLQHYWWEILIEPIENTWTLGGIEQSMKGAVQEALDPDSEENLLDEAKFKIGDERVWGKGPNRRHMIKVDDVVGSKNNWAEINSKRGRAALAAKYGEEGTREGKVRPKWRDKAVGVSENTFADFFPNGDTPQYQRRPSPERAELHHKIMSNILAEARPIPDDKTPHAVISIGAPGTGKSTVLSSMDTPNTVKIDPDAIMEELPEYQEAVRQRARNASSIVYQEAGWIADKTRDMAVRQRKNFVFDGVGRDADWYSGMVDKLQNSGYKVTVVHTAVTDVGKLPYRTLARAFERGRMIPFDRVISGVSEAKETFSRLMSKADGFLLVSTDDIGSPRPIYTKHTGEDKTVVHDKDFLREYLGLEPPGKEEQEVLGILGAIFEAESDDKPLDLDFDTVVDSFIRHIKKDNEYIKKDDETKKRPPDASGAENAVIDTWGLPPWDHDRPKKRKNKD